MKPKYAYVNLEMDISYSIALVFVVRTHYLV